MKTSLLIMSAYYLLVQCGPVSSSLGVAKFVTEYSLEKKWRNIIIIDNNQPTETNASLQNSCVLSIFRSLKEGSMLHKVTYSTDSQKDMVEYLKTLNAVKRIQFIGMWNEVIRNFVKQAGDLGFFSSQQEWLIIGEESSSLESIMEGFQSLPIYTGSDVVVGHYGNSNDELQLSELWRVGPSSSVENNLIGVWSEVTGLKLHQLLHRFDRRIDLKGYHIRVATIETVPYESLIENETIKNFKEGYVVDIWNILQEHLNFTYTATKTLFGSLQNDNTTWNGMVGMLQTNDSDVAVAPLSITQSRSFAIDFTIPIQIVSSRLYIRRPVLEATWVLYILPFDNMLWICIPCFVVFTAFWLWLLSKAANLLGCDRDDVTLLGAFWAMFSSLTQQSSVIEPKPFCSKLMFIVGYMGSLVLYTCYSSILVSILTTMKPSLPFTNFDDLRTRPDWSVGVRTNTALADSLALSPLKSPMRDAWETNVIGDPSQNLPKNNNAALENVLKGQYAFFANKEFIIYQLQNVLPIQDATNIVDTGKDFLTRGIGFGVQKNSPFKGLFNRILAKMTSSGQLNRLEKKWWPNIKREPKYVYPSPGLQEVFTVFLIFGLGIVLSILNLFFEKNRKPSSGVY